jgi:hypothetical protein
LDEMVVRLIGRRRVLVREMIRVVANRFFFLIMQ